MVSKRTLLFQGAIFRFHVKLWEGISLFFLNPKLQETVTCSFFVKDQQKMFDLFGGFYQIFNQDGKNSAITSLSKLSRFTCTTWTWHRMTTSKAVQRLIQKIQQLSETDYWNYCIKNNHQNLSKCKMTHSLTMQHAILSLQLAVGESSSTNARWIRSNQWHLTKANVWPREIRRTTRDV